MEKQTGEVVLKYYYSPADKKIFAFPDQIDSSRSRESKLHLAMDRQHHFCPSPIEIFFVFSVDLTLPASKNRCFDRAEAGEMYVSIVLPLLICQLPMYRCRRGYIVLFIHRSRRRHETCPSDGNTWLYK